MTWITPLVQQEFGFRCEQIVGDGFAAHGHNQAINRDLVFTVRIVIVKRDTAFGGLGGGQSCPQSDIEALLRECSESVLGHLAIDHRQESILGFQHDHF